MKLTSTKLKRFINWTFYLILLTLLTLNFSKSYAQQIYANTATVKSTVVDNPNNAVNGSGGFATIRSYGGLALGVGKYSGELELQFPNIVPANKTTFIRLDFNADVLNALLGGNLGADLANLLGSVVLGNHFFEVGARNSSGTVLSGASSGPFSSSNLRVVKDVSGAFYVAITPNQAYDRVYIKDHTAALLLGTNNETRVYSAFYNSGGSACDPAFATDFDGTGLTASLLGIGKAGVRNMENAIDNDPSSASEIGLGVIGVVGSISQNIYFNTASTATDELKIKFQINPTLVNAGLLNNVSIETFLGTTSVSSHSASSLLSVDLLGLLTSGRAVTVGIAPGQPFDRVKVSLTSLLNVSVAQNLNLFSVTRTTARPTFVSPQAASITTCHNSTVSLSATTASSNQLIWYDVPEEGTPLATTASVGTYTTPALTANKIYYVAAKQPGCEESVRVPVSITLNPSIVFATTTLVDGVVGAGYSKQINPATGGTPSFTYKLAVGSTLPSGLSLSAGGLISGTPSTIGTFNFSIEVKDSKNCTATSNFSIVITNGLSLPAATLPNGVVGTAYPTQNLPAATGGSGTYTYTATGLPPGLNFNTSTRAITGTPTTSGSYVITLRATDVDAKFVTRDYNLTVTAGLSLASGTLPDGTVGVNYPVQVLQPATGGAAPYIYSVTGLPPGLSFNTTTREITGIPTIAGTNTIVLTATDAEAKKATANYTLVVNSGSGIPDCNAANSQASDINGICVLCSITGPGNSVDGDKLNFTRITLAVGVAASGYQILNFPRAGVAADQIRLDLATPIGLADVSLLSGITVTVLNGSTVVNTYQLNSALISLQLLGGNRFTASVPAGGTFDRVEVRFSATVAALTSLDIYGAAIIYPKPTIATTGLSVCSGSTTTLSATPAAGTSLTWYALPTGGTPLQTGNTFTTPVLTANRIYYLEVARDGCANPERIPVAVVVSASPAAPVASTSNPSSVCATPVTLSVQQVAGITYRWFDATGVLLTSNGNSYTTAANLAPGTYNFFVEAVNGNSCASSTRTSISITIGTAAIASDIQVSGSRSVCTSASTVLTASSSTVSNPIFTWYSNANLSTVLFTGATFNTPVLTTNTTYYVTVKGSNKCENVVGTAAIITLSIGTPALASDIQVSGSRSICVSSSTVLTATSTTVSNPIFTWYSNANLTTVLFTGATFNTPVLSANTTYYVTVKGDGKCENVSGSAAVVTLTINTPATASDINVSGSTTVCASTSAVLVASSTTVTNPIFKWYADAALTNLIFTGATFTSPVLTANTSYYVTVTGDNKCENSSANAKVLSTVVNANVPAPILSSTGTNACIGNSTTLSIQNPQTGVSYEFYSAATGGTPIFTGATFTTPVLNANTDYYVQALSTLGCVNAGGRVKVTVNVTAKPLQPTVALASISTCIGSTAVINISNPQSGVTYNYYTNATGGTSIGTGNTFTTAALTANTIIYVEANAGSCSSASRTAVSINVGAVLAAPVISVQSKTLNSILFAWNAISAASGYEVSLDAGATWQSPSSGINGTTHLVSGLIANQNVTLTVRAKGTIGCQTSANATPVTEQVSTAMEDLFIPNTFTPNGDGRNDIFNAYGNSVTRFKMRIYNQWGQFISESNSLAVGWDGTYRGGMQPNGVYAYYIDVTFSSGKTKIIKGTITLLR